MNSSESTNPCLPMVLPVSRDDGKPSFGPSRRQKTQHLCAIFPIQPVGVKRLKQLKQQLDKLGQQHPQSPKRKLSIAHSDWELWWVKRSASYVDQLKQDPEMSGVLAALERAESDGMGRRISQEEFQNLQQGAGVSRHGQISRQDRVSVGLEFSRDNTWVYFPGVPNIRLGSLRWSDVLEAQLLWAHPDQMRQRWKKLAQNTPHRALRWLKTTPRLQQHLERDDLIPLLSCSSRLVRQQTLRQVGQLLKQAPPSTSRQNRKQ